MALSSSSTRPNGAAFLRTGRINVLLVCLVHAFTPLVKALPVPFTDIAHALSHEELPKSPHDASLWLYLGVAILLVLGGGIFAGLTIALMGQDEIYLQVLANSGEGNERKNAKRVLRLLSKGKHWVLVTLLLSNVITNETLPIVLDRSLGGGWPAVVSSTVLIVIFGEVVPQSICVRYGLPIGAYMSPVVLFLMYLMAPAAWPTAKLLDYLLGEDHGTVYKKTGLKTLVELHKTLGVAEERLNEDEVAIISGVLDLKAKPVGNIMTPMKDVFTMSSDTVLDEPMMDVILSAGYSRIPIHTPDNKYDFVGMLLVKMLITYDPEDALRVRDFALATLPETRPETSCLDIINFFQEGKSHMVLVSEFPSESYGAVGVVTLEDVIEELIGEEIIDESDVFVDVHKAIRRMAPAPRTRIAKAKAADMSRKSSEQPLLEAFNLELNGDAQRKLSVQDYGSSPSRSANFMLRRRSSGAKDASSPFPSEDAEILQHLKHLGPSNAANKPKSTRSKTVKIKPGHVVTPTPAPAIPATIRENSQSPVVSQESHAPEGGIGQGLFSSAGREASDGVHAVGYGTMALPDDRVSWKSGRSVLKISEQPTSPKSLPETNGPLPEIIDLVSETNGHVPEANGPVPKANGPVSEANESVSEAKRSIPETNGPVSEANGSVSEAKRSIPEAKGSVPEAKGSASETKGSIPETKGSVPEAKGSVPEAKGSVPEAKESVPEAKGSASETKGSVPEANRSISEANRSTPEANGSRPEANRPVPEAIVSVPETNGSNVYHKENGNQDGKQRSRSISTIGSLHSRKTRSITPPRKRHTARSGSITENIVDVNGVKKIILETTSSSDSEDKIISIQTDGAEDRMTHSDAESVNAEAKSGSKKKRKKRGKKKKANAGSSSETQPLLGSK